jgi:hypothetical protein
MAERYQQFLGTRPGIVVGLIDKSSSPYTLRTEDGFEFTVSAEDFRNYYREEGASTTGRWSHLVTDPDSGMVDSTRMSRAMDFIHSFEHAFPDFISSRNFVRDAVTLAVDPSVTADQLEGRLTQSGCKPGALSGEDIERILSIEDDLRPLLLSETVAVIRWPAVSRENGQPLEISTVTKEAATAEKKSKKLAPLVRRAGMKNVEMAVDGDVLTITIDLSKDFGPSKSGKTTIVASSEGNKSVPGREERIGLNVYKQEGKKPAKGRKTSFKNVTMRLEGDLLRITVDLSHELGPSKSGKTVILASTGGNQLVPGREEKIGLNVYRKIE